MPSTTLATVAIVAMSVFRRLVAQQKLPTEPALPDPPAPLTVDIEDLHRAAFNRKEKQYIDPVTGFRVFTAYTHLKRGRCCGSKCRHCPYGWKNVKNKVNLSIISNDSSDEKKSVPYTKTGDNGTSELFTGARKPKDDAVFEALGTVDELNSTIGLCHAGLPKKRRDELKAQLELVMSRLLDVGSHVATPLSDNANVEQLNLTAFDECNVKQLEVWIDEITEELPDLDSFVLPTGSDCCARLHVARTVCRRAERAVISLSADLEHNEVVRKYLNRLSDYLFSVARLVLYLEGASELRYFRQGELPQREIT
jgi:cob(I)alamin adenosyltransferase